MPRLARDAMSSIFLNVSFLNAWMGCKGCAYQYNIEMKLTSKNLICFDKPLESGSLEGLVAIRDWPCISIFKVKMFYDGWLLCRLAHLGILRQHGVKVIQAAPLPVATLKD